MDVRIVIRSPSGKSRSILRTLPLLVGRSEAASLRINQDSVSRRHCEFAERDGGVVVRDLGSTNGTMLEGAEIAVGVEVPVPSGGVLTVGGATFRLEYGSSGTTVAAGHPMEPAAVLPGPPEVETIPVPEPSAPGHDGAASEHGWSAVAEAPPDDGDLGDFFKSLS